MSKHLVEALKLAARDLEAAHRKAHPDAHRCRNCGNPFTWRIHEAERQVLYVARLLGEALLGPASAGEEEK